MVLLQSDLAERRTLGDTRLNIDKHNITIRTAKPADGFLIEAITREIWTLRVAPPSTVYAETATSVTRQLEKGGGVVVLSGNEVIGSGRWVTVEGPVGAPVSPWMEIKRIGVTQPFTGQGLGARVTEALEMQGRAAGVAGAQLAVRYDQSRLVDFYAALGYDLADDVQLTTVNPNTPPPIGMRKWF